MDEYIEGIIAFLSQMNFFDAIVDTIYSEVEREMMENGEYITVEEV